MISSFTFRATEMTTLSILYVLSTRHFLIWSYIPNLSCGNSVCAFLDNYLLSNHLNYAIIFIGNNIIYSQQY